MPKQAIGIVLIQKLKNDTEDTIRVIDLANLSFAYIESKIFS